MRLTHHDQQRIMQDFPSIKLSYVKNIHKKVSSANIFLAIPKGIKYFIWFKHFRNQYICLYMQIDRKGNNIASIEIKNCCFSEKICVGNGTILYGTMFTYNGRSFFTTEDIFLMKGKNTADNTQYQKLNYIQEIFEKYIKQQFLSSKDVIIGLPVMTKTRDAMDILTDKIPYTIYCIQHRYYKNNQYYYNERGIIKQNIFANFIVKAEYNDDIYTLYLVSKKTGELKIFNHALIANYKKSVFLNSIFRNIKENRNLDLLEESDDDEEFENIDLNKYIDENKQVTMKCVYNRKYKLWEPCEIINSENVAFFSDIIRIEKNNRY